VCGRLWRSCFYVRIGELRGRISKEKSRFRKLRKRGGGGEEMTPGGELDKQGKSIQTLEERLKVFIKEAVVLYEYLVDQFQEILLPHTGATQSTQSQSQNTQSQSQRSNTDDSTSTNEQKPGVVPTLHRLYIYLGDLHRYTCSYPSADAAYAKASCLAPGKGNPYNQLAVVAQLKDSSGAHPLPAVALYWYCRSLLAVHDAFETSRSNVERLFMANRKFLSLFCDFHGSLFCCVKEGQDGEGVVGGGGLKDGMWGKMEKDRDYLIRQFNMLLIESAFGDALLLKMVSINAFSIWNGLSTASSSMDGPQSLQTVMAISFAFEYAAQLSYHTEAFLEKVESKRQQQQQPPDGGGGAKNTSGIRLIGPLLMLCDFISYMLKRNKEMNELKDTLINSSSNSTHERAHTMFFQSERTFWAAITKLSVCLKRSDYISTVLQTGDGDDATTTELPLPNEFKSMTRGYAPFAFFDRGDAEFDESTLTPIPNQGKTKTQTGVVDAYLTFDEAVDALELYPARASSQSTSQQRSKKSLKHGDSKVGNQMEVQTRLKLCRFMKFISRHIDSGVIDETNQGGDMGVGVGDNQKEMDDTDLSPEETDMDWDSQTKDDINDSKSTSGIVRDDPEKDIIVYKATGNGPALLVPGALLVSSNEKQEKQKKTLSPQSSGLKNDTIIPGNKVNPSLGLLNLSTLLNQSVNDPDSSIVKNNSGLSPSAMNGGRFHNVTRHTDHISGIPPMPQSAPPKTAPKMAEGPALRPPPGFNNSDQSFNLNLQNVHNMAASSHLRDTRMEPPPPINFETMCQPYTGEKVYPGNPVPETLSPFPHRFQHGGRNVPYPYSPGTHSSAAHPPFIPPQTNNPFAYPMPPLGSNNNRFQGFTMPPPPPPPHILNDLGASSAPQLGTNNEPPTYFGVNLTHNAAHTNDTSTDLNMELGNDLFGLRSLGLYDDGVTKGPNGSAYLVGKDASATQNPFFK